MQNRAETALQGLPVAALPELFAELVEVNEQEVATRRRARKSGLKGNAAILADALVDARLLVTGEGEAHEPTLEVAHETVLTGWERLREWIPDHAEALRARRDLERVATEWDKSERHGSALRTGRLLQRYLGAGTPRSTTAEEYLAACIRRRRWFRLGYAALALVAMAALGVFLHVSKSQYGPALAAKGLLVELGLWPVRAPAMQPIPAGQFEMGDANGNPNEQPVHTVYFAKAFEMGKYEVTFDEYDLFAAATGRAKPHDSGWGRGDRPVINVSWDDAEAYTQWLSERTGLKFRLPSEAEWEYASRATTTTPWYWTEDGANEKDPACTYGNFSTENARTNFSLPRRSASSKPTSGGSPICSETCGSGPVIATRRVMRACRSTGPPRRVTLAKSVLLGCCAAALGSTSRRTCVPLSARGTDRKFGT